MFYRVKQFISAITATTTPEERNFIKKYLDEDEYVLFNKLMIYEQKHAVQVAMDVATNYKGSHVIEVIKGSLLHDIGKIVYPIGPIRKSIMVLLDYFTKGKMEQYTLFDMVKCYYKHPLLGYQRLKEEGCTSEIVLDMVKNHHAEEKPGDRESLRQLRLSDNKY